MSDVFPAWMNKIPTAAAVVTPLVAAGAISGAWYWGSPWYTDVGYQPTQPIPFSHRLHAGELGMDCRYCHNTVERAAGAAIPPNETCLNCHRVIHAESEKLEPLRESNSSGQPISWVKVHQLPDYSYFNHRIHVSVGVGCASCHGRIDRMEEVHMAKPLSMGWCLECHRNPEPNLRPPSEVTNMKFDLASYDPAADDTRVRQLMPPENCSGCHR